LLKDTGLTIQACVDPEWEEVGEELVAQGDGGEFGSGAGNKNQMNH
jgi:hypothetical protein